MENNSIGFLDIIIHRYVEDSKNEKNPFKIFIFKYRAFIKTYINE